MPSVNGSLTIEKLPTRINKFTSIDLAPSRARYREQLCIRALVQQDANCDRFVVQLACPNLG